MNILLWVVVKKGLEVASIREGRSCYMLDTMLPVFISLVSIDS